MARVAGGAIARKMTHTLAAKAPPRHQVTTVNHMMWNIRCTFHVVLKDGAVTCRVNAAWKTRDATRAQKRRRCA